MHVGLGEDAGGGRGEERLGASIGLLLKSPGEGQNYPWDPASFFYQGQAFQKDTEDREELKATRTPPTPSRRIKSVPKVTRELVGSLNFFSLGCSVFQPCAAACK